LLPGLLQGLWLHTGKLRTQAGTGPRLTLGRDRAQAVQWATNCTNVVQEWLEESEEGLRWQ